MSIEKSREQVMVLVGNALAGVAAHSQSARQLEEAIHKAAVACVTHAREHGDVMPMDRLVKGIPSDDHSVAMFRFELVAWCRANSPIRWNAKGEPRQAKEGEADYKPYNDKLDEAKAFFQTEQAVASREAAREAARRTLTPATFQTALNRAFGLRKWFNGLEVPSEKDGQVRGVVEADKTKITRLVDIVEKAIEAEFGVRNPNADAVSRNKEQAEITEQLGETKAA